MDLRKQGAIIPNGVEIWPHELVVAKTLADNGYVVEFLPIKKRKFAKSPDILMNGLKWEIKSPKSSKLSAIERNLKKAYHQSANIIFCSHRMHNLPDKSICKELTKQFVLTKKMKRLLFVGRDHKIIDISNLVWYSWVYWSVAQSRMLLPWHFFFIWFRFDITILGYCRVWGGG